MATLQSFRQYLISQDRTGGTVELWRSGTEVACLAADPARQTLVELHVAITPPDRQLDATSFQQLVQLAAPVRHRNVLSVIDGGDDDGANFYVTEFLDGERFDMWLARCNPLPPWLALQTIAQIVSGLCALAPHPRLLAGIDLLNCGVVLLGDRVEDLTAKICDLGLTAGPPALTEPSRVEAHLIREAGRLLLYMLTGAMPEGPVEPADPGPQSMAPELGFLVRSLFLPAMPHHPRTLDQMRTLVDRCRHDLSPELAMRPDRLVPALRPRLPLHVHFLTTQAAAEAVAEDITVDVRPFDALEPDPLRGVQRSTRQPVHLQILPPARLLPQDSAGLIRTAQQRISALEHPHLLRVLAWDETGHPELILEENPGRWSLDTVVRLKGRMEPEDAAVILGQCEDCVREAEACGLVPLLRSPQDVAVQFHGGGGDDALPGKAELARTPLDRWPAFRLRARTWPAGVHFLQPERCLVERMLPPEAGVTESMTLQRGNPFSHPPSARDYAVLAMWMLGGTTHVPEHLRSLVYDLMHNRSDPSPAARREFLERFTGHPLKSTAPVAPVSPRRSTQPQPAPRRTAPVPAAPQRATTAPVPTQGGLTPAYADNGFEEHGDAPAVGFAEALFGAAGNRTPGGSAGLPGNHPLAPPPDDETRPPWVQEFTEPEYSFLDGLPSDRGYAHREHGGYDPEVDGPEPAPGRLMLWVLIIFIAALIAGVAAHLNGTAFWLR